MRWKGREEEWTSERRDRIEGIHEISLMAMRTSIQGPGSETHEAIAMVTVTRSSRVVAESSVQGSSVVIRRATPEGTETGWGKGWGGG